MEPSPSYDFNFPKNGQTSTKTRFHIETMGCQMNVSDSEIVHSILEKAGMEHTDDLAQAGVILVNTCSIRDNAEKKVWERLSYLNSLRRKRNHYHSSLDRGKKPNPRVIQFGLPDDLQNTPQNTKIGVLGCMAERLKTDLLEAEHGVDLVAGPDAYRDLPNLLTTVFDNDHKAVNVALSVDETYADIAPVRTGQDELTAFVSIMRGCNNMCSYCIVPFTRGRERSREADTIVDEVRRLVDNGCKEVTLLGQNVNSYNYIPGQAKYAPNRDAKSKDFINIAKPLISPDAVDFTKLVDRVSAIDPELRVRFTSPHPKDFPDDLIYLIGERPNVCSNVHLPAQSGSTEVLKAMRRGYTREAYLRLVETMRKHIPDLTLSTDIIVGFCGESEYDHELTLSLMREVVYDTAFMFKYSSREKTHAHRRLNDDVPEAVKQRRLEELVETFFSESKRKNANELGKLHLVLVEGSSKRKGSELVGRSCSNKKIIFPALPTAPFGSGGTTRMPERGDYVVVRVVGTSAQTLRGELVGFHTMKGFYEPDTRPEFESSKLSN
ncbi:hypothetical protein AAMO2058_000182400 [Amorphochlora amoebiformis]